MRTVVVAAAVLLAACGDGEPAAAGQGRTATMQRRLDIAGVRPGMSADEARTTLERAGWAVRTSPGRDWKAEVAYEAGRQRGNAPYDQPRIGIETIDAQKGEEALTISLRAVPAGASVKHVNYQAPMAGRTAAQVGEQLVRRFGAPDKTGPAQAPLSMTWCSGGERCRVASGALKPALSVEEDVYHKLRMALYEGVEADRAWRVGLERAAGSGATPRSTF